MRKFLLILFFALSATPARSEDVTVRSFSPSSDRAQTLGTPEARWDTVYAPVVSDGEGSSFAVADVGEATRFATEKNHNELTGESRAAANSHPIGAITGLSGILRPATAASDGLMSSSDKYKLDNIDAASAVTYTPSGEIRLPIDKAYLGVDSLSADVPLVKLSGENEVAIGDTGHAVVINAAASPTLVRPNPDYAPGNPDSPETLVDSLAVLSDLAEYTSTEDLVPLLAAKADLVGGKVPSSQLPVDMVAQTWEVATVADLTTLADAKPGDYARITSGADTGKVYTLISSDPTVAANWIDITSSGGVISVNGYQGVVELDLVDFPGVVSALDSKAPLDAPVFSGIPTVPMPAASDSSNQIASTAWARQTITSMGSVTRVLSVYVAPTGTDAVTTTGASNDPYATPGYALDQIRIKNPGRISRVTLNIAAGVYNSTINLVEATPYAIIDRLVISGAGRDATTIASDTYIDLRYVAVDTLEMNDFTFEHSGTTTSITLRRGRITFTNIGVRRTNATSGAGLTLNAVDYFSCDGLSFEGNYTAVIQAVNGSTCTITGSNPIIFKSGSASSSIITCQTGSYVNIASSTTNSLSYEESWTNPGTPLRANSEGVIIPNSASTLTAWLAGGSAYTDAEPSFIKFYSTRAPLVSPAFTGTPTAPTAAAGTDTDQLATTRFVATAVASVEPDLSPYVLATDLTAALALKANLASPIFAGTPRGPTATAGTNTTQLATTEFVQTAVSNAGGGSGIVPWSANVNYGVDGAVEFVTGSDDKLYKTTLPSGPGTSSGAQDPTVSFLNDEIVWTQANLPASRTWRSIAYGDGKFVAVAANSANAAYSTDGITWTQTTMPDGNWTSVTYGNGKFVAVTYNSTTTAYSTDAISWTRKTLPSITYLNSIAYGIGKFVATGGSSIDKRNIVFYSTDGSTWAQTTMPVSANWNAVTYGNGKFVAVSEQDGASYSLDGITWTQTTMPVSVNWNAVTYGNGKFVAVTSSTIGAYSLDGITWTQTTMPVSANWNAVTYGNGKFVAVTSSTIGAYSLSELATPYWIELISDAPRDGRIYARQDGNWVIIGQAEDLSAEPRCSIAA